MTVDGLMINVELNRKTRKYQCRSIVVFIYVVSFLIRKCTLAVLTLK